MKFAKTFTLPLATVVFAAAIGVGSAYAAQQPATTYYPDSFLCSLSFDGELVDYAIFGDTYAFAYSGQLAVLTGNGNNERLPDIKPVSSINRLDYSEDGKLYVCFADGYCIYPDLENKYDLNDITVQDKGQDLVTIDGAHYYLNGNDGSILYLNGGSNTVTPQDTHQGEIKFSHLKVYGGTAYAVMSNALYRLEGAAALKVDPTYYGYVDMTKAISTGDSAQALKTDSPITYGWIEKNKHFTEINLEKELGTTFEVPNPSAATRLSEDRLYCMVLAESGNAYIVTIGDKCYLTAKTSVTVDTNHPTLDAADVQTAYAVEEIGVYSRPYLSPNTRICSLESGSQNAVTVLGQYTDLTGIKYYYISYDKGDGTQIMGYVAKELMTAYSFPAEDDEIHTDGGDKEFKYDTNVVTVALAIAIVALVIIAVLYVAAASSKNKRNNKKQKNRSAERNRRKHDDEVEDDEEE